MKIDHRFVSIHKLTTYFGDEICGNLPAYHSLTGCDITSYSFRIVKIKPFKKIITHNKCYLLSDLGRTPNSYKDLTKAKCFFRTCIYSGTEQERFVQTRIQMYIKQKKIKSSLSLLPDENSTEQHLTRSDLQANIWY